MRAKCGLKANAFPAFLMSLLFLVAFTGKALEIKDPSVRFSFNNGSNRDEITRQAARMIGTVYIKDRFGNDNNAVFILGNQYSYINLGCYPALKPVAGTISMWVNLGINVWAGNGYKINPFIVTKNSVGDDFYEAYAIYYFLEGGNIGSCMTQDSTRQIGVISSKKFTRYEWHHVVMTYDDNYESLYIDGKLDATLKKGYRTLFLSSDSVMVGISANKKNNRFFNGGVDDIEIYDRVLNAEEVKSLFEAPDPNRERTILHWLFVSLVAVLILVLIFLFVKFRLSLRLKKEKHQLELYNMTLETELRVNKALMNPHFVFNSLNTLQNFILKNENDKANGYLIKFSKFIRKVLESNISNKITLDQEIELLRGYLEIENLRFEENIKYSISVDPAIKTSITNIPVMMLQPFVENAIWHGLLTKRGEKQLTISFALTDGQCIVCSIEDNGVGRQVQKEKPGGKRSLAIGFIEQRLNLLNQIHHTHCSLKIEDKPNHGGTIVCIVLPILE